MAVAFVAVEIGGWPFGGGAIVDGDSSVFVWSSTVQRPFERVPARTRTDDPDERIERVACVAYEAYTHKTISGPNARVLDDEVLHRSAELLAGAFATSSAARRMEDERLGAGLSPTDATALVPGLDLDPAEEAEARAYLVALEMPPSPSAFQDFVVFETLDTRTSTRVVRLGGLDADPGYDFGRFTYFESRVETQDGLVFSVPAGRCDDDYASRRLRAVAPVATLVVVALIAMGSLWRRRRQRSGGVEARESPG